MLQRGQGHARLTSRGLDNAGSHRRRDLTMFEFFSKICPRPQRAPNFCYGHRDHRGEAGHIDGLDPFDKTLVISTFQIASKWQILRFSVVLNLEGEAKLSPISVIGTDHRLFHCDSSGSDGLANILSQSVAIPLRELKSASWISVAAAGMIESGSTRHAEEGSCPIRVTWVCCRR